MQTRGGCGSGRRPAGWVLLLVLTALVQAAEPTLQLSAAERGWIAAHPVVRIQMSDVSPPFEFRDGGRWTGLSYDILQEATRRLGLRIEVTGMPWASALENISEGKGVDLLLAVTRSPERERQMALTRAYLSFPQVVFADKRHPFLGGLEDLARSRIAVESDYVMLEWLRRDLPQAQLVTVPDSPTALNAVSSGLAEAYIGNLAVGSYLIDHLGLVNLGVVAPTGYGDEEFAMGVRRDWPELVALLDRAVASIPPEQMSTIRQRWLSVRYEHGLRSRDIALSVLAVVALAAFFIVQLRTMVANRTRELKREVELRRAKEQHLAQAQRIASVGSWSEDLRTGELTWSEETGRILAWTKGGGATQEALMAVVHPDDVALRRRLHVQARCGGGAVELEFRVLRADGGVRHVQERCQAVIGADGLALHLDGVVRDITAGKQAEAEREQFQRALLHSEKMRVLGQLAGGIAHDVNNQLSGITGNADLLARTVGLPGADPAKSRTYAERILQSACRAAAITAQLRVFSRRDAVEAVPVDVHAVIRDASELARRGSSAGIDIDLRLDAEAATVVGDAAQIESALLNLALNSRDAMPAGGRLTFRTAVENLAGPPAGSQAFGLVEGRHLRISVIDTGSGMSAEVMARLFEPFFTTKGSGKGTGLGLANVHACIRNHHGAIAVESRLGHGTTFHLWLALSDLRVATTETAPISGGGRVLVVDDDAELRAMAVDMLALLGFTCVQAGDGGEALRLIGQQPFDLVLLDMQMPGMGGVEALARIRAIAPGTRVAFCSGSLGEDHADPDRGADGFIRKPYQLADLSLRIAAVMARTRG